jgi:antitoxin component YwqK of YwqJK toxin-antitoxin module
MNRLLLNSVNLILLIIILPACQYLSFEKKNIVKEVLTQGVDGVQKKYRKNKSLLSAIEHKDKKRHGISRLYYKDGKTVHNEIRYKMGIKHGITKSYYPNGQLYYSVPYLNGEREGIMKKYYKTGEIMAEVPYKEGNSQPGLIEYQKTGNRKVKYPSIVFEEIDKAAFENKLIVRIKLSNGKKDVKFSKILFDNKGNEFSERFLLVENGTSNLNYPVFKNRPVDEKLKIKAEIKTFLGNPLILFKEKRIRASW